MKLAEIADIGDNLETLKALRQKLATAIDRSESGRDISSLARQLQIVLIRIEELEEAKRLDADDPIGDIIGNTPKVRRANRRPAFSDDFDDFLD